MLAHTPAFPEQPFASLWHDRHLPPPSYHDGKSGLTALQRLLQQRSGFPFNYAGDWQNQIDHLLYQEEKYRRIIPSSIPFPQDNETEDVQEFAMSMRPKVDRGQIEQLLKNLGSTLASH